MNVIATETVSSFAVDEWLQTQLLQVMGGREGEGEGEGGREGGREEGRGREGGESDILLFILSLSLRLVCYGTCYSIYSIMIIHLMKVEWRLMNQPTSR